MYCLPGESAESKQRSGRWDSVSSPVCVVSPPPPTPVKITQEFRDMIWLAMKYTGSTEIPYKLK